MHSFLRAALAGLSGCLLLAVPVRAQAPANLSCSDACCASDPTPAGIMISHLHPKGEWMLSYRYMHMQMGPMQSGTGSVTDEAVFSRYLMSADAMQMQMHMLMAMVGLTDRVTVMGMLNYNNAAMEMRMLPGSSHTHHSDGAAAPDSRVSSSGLGDARLHLLFGLLSTERHHLLASAGVSLPTGSIYAKGAAGSMYPGQRLPYNMQPGSGTWELLPGLSYLYRHERLTVGTQLAAALRPAANAQGYRFGNEISLSPWCAWQWGSRLSTSVRAEGAISGQISGRNAELYAANEPAADPANYGGRRAAAYVGAQYHFRSGLPGKWNSRLGAEAGLPVYQHLNGIQMRSRHSLTFSYSVQF